MPKIFVEENREIFTIRNFWFTIFTEIFDQRREFHNVLDN